MVTITTQISDLERLFGRKLPRDVEQLNELLYSVKCEISGVNRVEPIQDTTELQLENKDTNRPDIWSAEGIARALRGFEGIELGLKRYVTTRKPAVEISVDRELQNIRPYISCVVALNTRIDDLTLRGLIRLQEKLDQSYGRRRRRASIGFYNFDLMTPPLRYGVAHPDEVKFVPLEGTVPMSLREILRSHPKGIEYGHIVDKYERMPILLDSKGKVLSFPPIINSNDLGRVTPETKNILVEITGTSEETVMNSLNILATTLADRGAVLSSAIIRYPYPRPRTLITPNLTERRVRVRVEDVRRLTGLELTATQVSNLLKRARFGVARSDQAQLTVLVPPYRIDILHTVDIIEDIAIAYGLNRMKPKWPSEATRGGLSALETFSDTIRELILGHGFQEVLTFMMSNSDKLFAKMNLGTSSVVEVSNPKISTMTCLRSWLLPSLMDFLSNNTHVEYPQRLFEVGDCVIWDIQQPNRTKTIRKLACVSAHSRANFTEMKSHLEPFMANLGFEFELRDVDHSSFIDGRTGSVLIGDREVGVIGEIHPQVLENWKLEDPVAAMELNVEELYRIRSES